jgi:diaminopimelate epimerase
MRMLPFVKMHGIGNDYVYVDGHAFDVRDAPTLARHVSDRHRGIGSDGLIVVAPPSDARVADVRMRMFNADGSEGRMCGNGIRCVAKFAVDRGIARANPLRVETRRGTLEVQWRAGEDGRVSGACVDMGAPILDPASVPVKLEGNRAVGWEWGMERWAEASRSAGIGDDATRDWMARSGIESAVSFVSMGNPHMVSWCACVDAVPLGRIGPAIERMPLFPERVNVHVVEPSGDGALRMRTWERGSGITQACGTGACAVCVAGALEGRCGSSVRVTLPGGTLEVGWAGGSASVMMDGPAVTVFEGVLDLDATGAPPGIVRELERVR